jgi:hypothetical protein
MYPDNSDQKPLAIGRKMAQSANPFQQNPGEDNNVEQQALSQALQPQAGEQKPQQNQNVYAQAQPGQIQVPAGIAAGEYNPNAGPMKDAPQPAQPQASGYKPPFLLGFETSKLLDPNKTEGESGKYTAAAKAFGQAYLSGRANISRGNLQPMIDAVRGQFPNARIVGDDKIDFGDGKGPIDVIGSDGTVRFQNTLDNAQYMAGHGGGGAQPAAPAGHGGVPAPAQPTSLPPAPPMPPPAPPLTRPDGTIYQPGQLPADTAKDYEKFTYGDYSAGPYKQYDFTQFNGPNQSAIEGQQQALLQQILAHPETMSDMNVAALKEKNKEEAVAMQKQLEGQMDERLAGRGFSGGGGLAMAGKRQLGEDVLSQVLSGNRDVDLQKMMRDREDQLGALGAGTDFLNAQMGRATSGYASKLAGQNAQAGEQHFAHTAADTDAARRMQRDALQAGEGQFAFQAGMDRSKAALDRALAGEQLKMQGADSAFRNWQQDSSNFYTGRGQDIQNALGQGGLAIDRARLASSDRQFDLSNALAQQELAERIRQFNGQMGYNYNALTQSGQNALIQQILGMS